MDVALTHDNQHFQLSPRNSLNEEHTLHCYQYLQRSQVAWLCICGLWAWSVRASCEVCAVCVWHARGKRCNPQPQEPLLSG